MSDKPLDIPALKAEAYLRRTANPGSVHGHILEQIAKEHGYKTWAALLAANKPKEES